jgi:oligoendopeptidase F
MLRLMAAAGDYRYWLEEMRHFKPHTLSEPEEKIVNIKNVTGVGALQHLYDTITNGYVFKLEVDGEVRELTRGQLMVYVRQHDPDLRAAAYQAMYRVYSEDSKILGQMYQTLVRDWRNEQVELRKFSNPIAARNLVNNIPDEVVDMLLEVCQRNADMFQRFFQLKARWLKMDRLRRYDIYAPVAKSDKTYTFDTATGMVFDSFEVFASRVAQLAQRVFDDNHLERGTQERIPVLSVPLDGSDAWVVSFRVVPQMSPPWHMSWVTLFIVCSLISIHFSPSMPACPWQRLPPPSGRCC